jgi:hypothetical protein
VYGVKRIGCSSVRYREEEEEEEDRTGEIERLHKQTDNNRIKQSRGHTLISPAINDVILKRAAFPFGSFMLKVP